MAKRPPGRLARCLWRPRWIILSFTTWIQRSWVCGRQSFCAAYEQPETLQRLFFVAARFVESQFKNGPGVRPFSAWRAVRSSVTILSFSVLSPAIRKPIRSVHGQPKLPSSTGILRLPCSCRTVYEWRSPTLSAQPRRGFRQGCSQFDARGVSWFRQTKQAL